MEKYTNTVTTKQRRRPGRPPRAAAPSLERVEIRVTKAEKRAWERDAKACGRTLSEWIRDCVNAVYVARLRER